MKIVEIFDSIDGEGIRTGQTATFIRLAGCNLRCGYCDTLYALFGEEEPCEYTEMTIEEVIQKVNKSYKRVTLTGGEPLLQTDSAKLVSRLLSDGYEVNIETNGAVDITEFLSRIPRSDKLFFTIDYKLPSSGMTDRMIWKNFLNLRPRDVVKFVVGSDEDVRVTIEIVKRLRDVYSEMPHIFIGAVYGRFDIRSLVEIILKEPILKDARLQVQLHKIIWDPNERGV
ncbi:MAG: radical SAM protein [Firmicutes bacterium]|nr:radical SAM protein [Bacillota bacterium]